jgi:hypothetical protein
LNVDRYLLVNGLGNIRVAKHLRANTIRVDEVAFHVQLKFSDAWKNLVPGTIEIQMPDPPQILETEIHE